MYIFLQHNMLIGTDILFKMLNVTIQEGHPY